VVLAQAEVVSALFKVVGAGGDVLMRGGTSGSATDGSISILSDQSGSAVGM
jgi:hypothetical protein